MLRKLLFCLLFISLSFGSSSVCLATIYFEDDFTTADISVKWESPDDNTSGEPSWIIEEGMLKGIAGSGQSSRLFANLPYDLADYVFESKVLNVSGVDQQIQMRVSPDKGSYYMIGYRYQDFGWPQDNNNIVLYRFNNGRYTYLDGYPNILNPRVFDLVQGVEHDIKVILDGRLIRIYFDGFLAVNYSDRSSDRLISGGFGLQNWGGNYGMAQNNYYYVKLSSLDDGLTPSATPTVIVEPTSTQTPTPTSTLTPTPTLTPTLTLTPSPTLTPTPTATPTPIRKIIIIPGLGASWNPEAIVLNNPVADNQWSMTPFVHNYDLMARLLEKNGLIRNSDYFIWNYDWRKPLDQIVEKLDNFIEENVGIGERVDMVGHSLGGVVARVWAQKNGGDLRLGEIISLGSPHHGALGAYEAWNGAVISDQPSFSTIALNILVQLQKRNRQTNLETIRSYAPILKDLIPTDNFLKMNGMTISNLALATRNDYLLAKNEIVSPIFDKLTAMVGVGFGTREWINMGKRKLTDEALGMWPEGRPINYAFGDGDETVLKTSAGFVGDDSVEVTSNHGDLPDRLVNNVVMQLGLGVTEADIPVAIWKNKLIFYIGSPVRMEVRCGGEWINSDEMGFVVIEGNYSVCEVRLTGLSEGIYHLVVGNSDKQNSWRYFEGKTRLNQIDNLSINMNSDLVEKKTANLDYLYGLISSDIAELQTKGSGLAVLKLAMNATKRREAKIILEMITLYRGWTKELPITNRIFDNLESIMMIENKYGTKNTAGNLYRMVWQEKNLYDKTTQINRQKNIKLSVFGAINYQLFETKLVEAQDLIVKSNYSGAMAKLEIARKMGGLVWWSGLRLGNF